MLAVLSPAKSLDFSPPPADLALTDPAFPAQTGQLAAIARGLSAAELARLMGISDALATLNRDRFQAFAANPGRDAVKQAVLCFSGDTYVGLDAGTLPRPALLRAQDRLRILSGLYGLLRPLDGIQPYRLEMGTRLATPAGTGLYAFWGDRITDALAQAADATGARAVINLASQEYFKAVRHKRLGIPVITPVFKEQRGATAKVIGFSAKRARGMMARHIIEHDLTDPADLIGFRVAGYRYVADQSDPTAPVFIRDTETPAAQAAE